MNSRATASCALSSLTRSLQTILVSTARMLFANVAGDAFFELLQCTALGRTVRKQSFVNIVESVFALAPDDDSVALFVPLDDGARYESQPFPHLSRDGDLSLRGQFRFGDGHTST